MLRRIFGDIVVRKRTGFVECEDATLKKATSQGQHLHYIRRKSFLYFSVVLNNVQILRLIENQMDKTIN